MGQPRLLTILGINFSGADPNAALVVDGEVAAAAEEERFVREKRAYDQFPCRALRYCVEEAARRNRAIDAIAFGWDCRKYSDGTMAEFYETEMNARYPVDEATREWQKRMIATLRVEAVTRQVHRNLADIGFDSQRLPPIHFLGHHRTHAAGAYLLSRHADASVLTLDGSGEDLCTGLWACRQGEIDLTRSFSIPHSLGWYYAALTEYLGFRAYDGEYKVMGLASYGGPNPVIGRKLRRVLQPAPADGVGYALDPRFIHYGTHSYSDRYTDHFVELLGHLPRRPETEPTVSHQEVAFEGQALLEQIGVDLAREAVDLSGQRALCLAGGTALNCKMSQRILESNLVDDLFVLPNAGDGGHALSAAVLLSYQLSGHRPEPLTSLALGPSYSDDEIKSLLDECLLSARHVEDVATEAARDLAAGKVLGWFQGRMEFGPRALGQRSILADPRRMETRDRVNRVVKYRERWRPFCPSVTTDAARLYFPVCPRVSGAPFMTITLPVSREREAEIAAVVHVDNTSRPQFVERAHNPLFYDLLKAFGDRTGVPVLLNTSFNLKGEPIVCSPQDALRTFFSSGMDILYVGRFRLQK